jgi:hypothetical protein
MAGASVIDEYVAELDERLRGDRQVKADLLTEARDSLVDAADCYRDAGLSEEDAQAKAVGDFGPVQVIARDFQGELAAAYGTRTLRSILFVLPVVHLFWEGTRLLWVGPWENFGAPPPSWYYPFAWINDSMIWAVSIAAALTLLAVRLLGRRICDSRIIARCSAGVAVVAVGASAAATIALLIATMVFDVNRLFISPWSGMAGLVSLLVVARLLVMARRTAVFCAA